MKFKKYKTIEKEEMKPGIYSSGEKTSITKDLEKTKEPRKCTRSAAQVQSVQAELFLRGGADVTIQPYRGPKGTS